MLLWLVNLGQAGSSVLAAILSPANLYLSDTAPVSLILSEMLVRITLSESQQVILTLTESLAN